MDRRTEAIQQFVELHALEETAMQALKAVFAQKPRALLMAWETETGVGVTSVPFSMALVHGMMKLLEEMLEADEEEADENDEEDG